MKQKKNIVLFFIFGCSILFVQFSYKKSAGAHPGSTGAPGDNTCAKTGCHVGFPVVNNDTTVNKLIFSQADSTYLPGQTYTITIQTTNPGIQRFGFEFQAINDATGLEAGTVVVTDAVRTHEVTHMVGSNFRTSVTHNTVSTPELSPGYNEWTFDWTAPATNEGDIVFYYATNSTNNNNTETGDHIFNNTFRIKISPLFSVNELVNVEGATVYYNAELNQIDLSYVLKKESKVGIRIYDAFGREIFKQNSKTRTPGEQKEGLALRRKPDTGIYYVNVLVGDKSFSKKVNIQ